MVTATSRREHAPSSRFACALAVAVAVAVACAACATGIAPAVDGGPGVPGAPDAPVGPRPDAAPPGTPDAAPPGTPDAGRIPLIDAGTGCVASPCELVPQCGCPAGEACDLDGTALPTGGTACRPVTAPGMELSTCGGTTTCAAGFVCLGLCHEYCENDTQCTAPGGLCTIQITYGSPPMIVPGARVCSPNCNPLTSTGCPVDWGCHVYRNTTEMRSFTSCAMAGAGDHGTTCVDDDTCAAGLSCVNTGGGSVCLKNCNVTTNLGCSTLPGSSCVGFADPAVIGATEYGVCYP